MNTSENDQCLCDLESEWDACVQDALNDVGENVTTNLQCRVNARIDSADMFDALALPYLGALRKRDAELVGREALRKCRRDLSHDLNDVVHAHGGARHRRLVKFQKFPNLQISPNRVTWGLALILDVLALILLCDPIGDLYSACAGLLDIFFNRPETVSKGWLKDIGLSLKSIFDGVQDTISIAKAIVKGLVALVKMTVLLWVLSRLHKIIARNSIARQAEDASEQIVASLLAEMNLRKKELLHDPDLEAK